MRLNQEATARAVAYLTKQLVPGKVDPVVLRAVILRFIQQLDLRCDHGHTERSILPGLK